MLVAILQSATLIKNGCINCRLFLIVISNEFALCSKGFITNCWHFKDYSMVFHNKLKIGRSCEK